MILISAKDGKFWPRHEDGRWFSDEERAAWQAENDARMERIASDAFNSLFKDHPSCLT